MNLKIYQKILLLFVAAIIIINSVDLLNYNSWFKFISGVILIVFAFIIVFVVIKSFIKNQN